MKIGKVFLNSFWYIAYASISVHILTSMTFMILNIFYSDLLHGLIFHMVDSYLDARGGFDINEGRLLIRIVYL